MFARLAIVFCIILPIGAIPARGQEASQPGAAFRLVTAKNVEKLQQELDRAAAEGYAVALGWPAHELVVLRQRGDAEPRPEYRVFSGKKAIEGGLAPGYRAVPDTLDTLGGRLVVIARKASEVEKYDTLLLQANRTSTLDMEIQDARVEGFRVVDMASDDSAHSAMLERTAGGSAEAGGAGAVAFIAANLQDTLQKELADRAAAGYRLVQSSSWKEVLLSLERHGGEKPVEYRVLFTTKSGTLEQEINAAAAQGFRFVPGTLHPLQKGAIPMFGRMGTEYVAIMEESTGADAPREYFIVSARRLRTLAREFDDAVARGLVPVALTLGYSDQETLVLFERARRP